MAIGLGDIVAFLALAGFSAIAWRRQRNVGGKTWAFRIVPLGIILMLVVSSNEAVIACAMLTFAAYAFTAYRGGWRLTWPKNHWLHGVWWMVHVIVYFILIFALCFTTASVVRLAVRFSPLPSETWTRGNVSNELPFAVEYKRAKTLCAEYDKRIRFKSGKTVGIWPDTGGGGPFAVYALQDGEYYIVDGIEHGFLRNEYRVNCRNETVDMRYMDVWLRIPDGSLEITGVLCDGNKASPRYLITVQTENGEIKGSQFEPVTENPEAEQLIGEINANGKFVRKVHP